MIYYAQVETEEHMLYCYEIAIKYNIYSLSNKPHDRLVSALLKSYYNEHTDLPKYYYNASRGLNQVYPAFIYEKAVYDFIKPFDKNIKYTIKIDDKNHNFIIK